jgi:P4 family phage/plasmid primase-like protien
MEATEEKGFSETKLSGTLRMVAPLQKNRLESLNENHISLADGFLDCSTMEMTQENRLSLLHIPIAGKDIDSYPEPKKWIKFLNEVFVDDDGKPSGELIDLVSLMCGYVLMPHLKCNRIFMLAGPTASNGKSTFLKILSSLFPPQLVAHQRFRQFASSSGTNWHKAELPGKRLIVCNEESSKDVDASILKDMADGMGRISAERKYLQPFEFIFMAKIICAFNTPPMFDRVDAGVLRRFCFIPCLAQFDGNIQADDIVSDILTERDQILAWMLRQAKRLKAMNWRFPDGSKISQDAKQEMLLEQNSALEFCTEQYVRDDAAEGISFNQIYDEYVAYAEMTKRKPFSRISFGMIANRDVLGKSVAKNGLRLRLCRKKTEAAVPQRPQEIYAGQLW